VKESISRKVRASSRLLSNLVDPQRVDLRHAEQATRVGGRRGVEDVDVVLILEHEIDHVLEHRRLLERGVHRGRLDEVVGLGRDVGELEKPPDLLTDFHLAALDALPCDVLILRARTDQDPSPGCATSTASEP